MGESEDRKASAWMRIWGAIPHLSSHWTTLIRGSETAVVIALVLGAIAERADMLLTAILLTLAWIVASVGVVTAPDRGFAYRFLLTVSSLLLRDSARIDSTRIQSAGDFRHDMLFNIRNKNVKPRTGRRRGHAKGSASRALRDIGASRKGSFAGLYTFHKAQVLKPLSWRSSRTRIRRTPVGEHANQPSLGDRCVLPGGSIRRSLRAPWPPPN